MIGAQPGYVQSGKAYSNYDQAAYVLYHVVMRGNSDY